MYIEFKTKKLKQQCERQSKGVEAWGEQLARKVVQRLNELKYLPDVQALRALPHLRCHPLKGNRAGQYAIDLDRTVRPNSLPSNSDIHAAALSVATCVPGSG